jgi:transcription antitermination factor NusA-like protein
MESLCENCILGEELCRECSEKLQSGSISQLEMDVQRAIYQLGERFPAVREANIRDVLHMDDMVVIITDRRSVGLLIGRGGRVAKVLSRKLKRRIRILSISKGLKELVQDALYPAQLLGLNIVYLPGSEEKYRAVISKTDQERLPFGKAAVEKLLKHLTGKDVTISLEE